jgi:hypothetical protein
MSVSDESKQDLLRLAHEHSYDVSETQLARWHRAGLLPRPLQQAYAGGSRTIYPAGTGEQFLYLCKLRTHERRFSSLAWQLWWEGYRVDMRLIRPHLNGIAQGLSQRTQACIELRWNDPVAGDDTHEIPERMFAFIEQLTATPLEYKPLRRVRKRMGQSQFSTLMRILIEIVSGSFQNYDSTYDRIERLSELRILAKGLGLNELFIRDDGNIEHYMGKVVVPLLQRASLWFRTMPWVQALSCATDFDFQQARDEIRQFLALFLYATPQSQSMVRDNPALRDLPTWSQALFETLQSLSMDDQALLLVMWLALRCAG